MLDPRSPLSIFVRITSLSHCCRIWICLSFVPRFREEAGFARDSRDEIGPTPSLNRQVASLRPEQGPRACLNIMPPNIEYRHCTQLEVVILSLHVSRGIAIFAPDFGGSCPDVPLETGMPDVPSPRPPHPQPSSPSRPTLPALVNTFPQDVVNQPAATFGCFRSPFSVAL